MLTGSAVVMVVRDMTASLEYYRAALGFDVSFEWGTPVSYACLCRDEVQLHLSADTARQPGQSALCIFVKDVDALHAELVANGAQVVKPPQDYAYGMRDFDVTDPDGNRIIFGMASAA
jgi:catechol 2,3-dioxygenase-like lactoylglutathione lyase family enzyme